MQVIAVKIGFVDQLSGKYIKSSKLLGEPKYTVSINGETQELTGKDGASQSIDVEVDGESLELTADVNYLKDYTDSASYTFKVCTLDINVDAFKSANLKTLEDGANQITVEATRNDQPLTKEQWDAATLDVVSVNKDGEEFGIQWDVQKGSEVSTWIVTPKYKKDKSDVGIPLNEAGDLVRAPYKFVAKLKLEREDLYDEVKGEV